MYGIKLKLKQGPMYGCCDPVSAAVAGSAVLGYMGQQEASGAATAMAGANRAQQQRQWELSDPFSATGQRGQYVEQLNQLMKGGFQGIQEDPMYKWMAAQGLDRAQRGASATGTAQSGQEQIALQQQGFGLASSFFQDQFSRLTELSGASSKTGGPGSQMTPSDAYSMTAGKYNALGGVMQGLAGLYGQGATGGGAEFSDMTGFQTPTAQLMGPEQTTPYTFSYLK